MKTILAIIAVAMGGCPPSAYKPPPDMRDLVGQKIEYAGCSFWMCRITTATDHWYFKGTSSKYRFVVHRRARQEPAPASPPNPERGILPCDCCPKTDPYYWGQPDAAPWVQCELPDAAQVGR